MKNQGTVRRKAMPIVTYYLYIRWQYFVFIKVVKKKKKKHHGQKLEITRTNKKSFITWHLCVKYFRFFLLKVKRTL